MRQISNHTSDNPSLEHGDFSKNVEVGVLSEEILWEFPFLKHAVKVIRESSLPLNIQEFLQAGIWMFFENTEIRSVFAMLYKQIDDTNTPFVHLYEYSFVDSFRRFISISTGTINSDAFVQFLLSETKKAYALAQLKILFIANIQIAQGLGKHVGHSGFSADQLEATIVQLQIQEGEKSSHPRVLKHLLWCVANNRLLMGAAREILSSTDIANAETYTKILAVLYGWDVICRRRNTRLNSTRKIENPSWEICTSLYGGKMVQTLVSYITDPHKKAALPPTIFGEIIKASKINLEDLRIEDIPFLSYKNWIFQAWNEDTKRGKILLEKMRDFYRMNMRDSPEALVGILKTFDDHIIPGAHFYMLFLDKELGDKSNFWEDENNMIAALRFTPYTSNDGKKAEYVGGLNIDSAYQKYGLIMIVKEAIAERMEKYQVEYIYAHVRSWTPVERLWSQLGCVETGNNTTIARSHGVIDVVKEIRLDRKTFLNN